MRLELTQVSADAAASAAPRKWYLDRGRRTLGRSPDCDWQVEPHQRTVSKLHCTIERDRDGFILRDESANGSRVDGVTVHEGETARLAHQSRIELGGVAFSVSISGEPEREMEDPEIGLSISEEPLTISAILADIAPGGSSGRGILGDRDGGELPVPKEPRPGAPSSRNVDIGWNGPPQLSSATKLLPDDWNIDDSGSGYGSHLEHGSATHVAVPIARLRAEAGLETVPDNGPVVEDGASERQMPDPAAVPVSFSPAGQFDLQLARMEEALENAFAVFDLDLPARHDGFFDDAQGGGVAARFEAVIAAQQCLAAALAALMQEAGPMLEPRILESRVDATASRISLLKGHEYWRAYKAQFDRNGRSLSVSEVFREAMKGEIDRRARLHGTDDGMASPAANQGYREDEADR